MRSILSVASHYTVRRGRNGVGIPAEKLASKDEEVDIQTRDLAWCSAFVGLSFPFSFFFSSHRVEKKNSSLNVHDTKRWQYSTLITRTALLRSLFQTRRKPQRCGVLIAHAFKLLVGVHVIYWTPSRLSGERLYCTGSTKTPPIQYRFSMS